MMCIARTHRNAVGFRSHWKAKLSLIVCFGNVTVASLADAAYNDLKWRAVDNKVRVGRVCNAIFCHLGMQVLKDTELKWFRRVNQTEFLDRNFRASLLQLDVGEHCKNAF